MIRIYDSSLNTYTATFDQPEWSTVQAVVFANSGKIAIGLAAKSGVVGNTESGETTNLEPVDLNYTRALPLFAGNRLLFVEQAYNVPATLAMYDISSGKSLAVWHASVVKDK